MPNGLASDGVFSAYEQALVSLSEQGDIEVTLRQFEFALLDEMGLLPDFTTDVEYEMPIEENGSYHFQADAGFVQMPEHIQGNRGFPGTALLSLAQGEFTPLSKKVAKVLCRDLLKPLIGDKPLKSRELFMPKGR
jgi:DNA repair protein RecO (recombination protein O)